MADGPETEWDGAGAAESAAAQVAPAPSEDGSSVFARGQARLAKFAVLADKAGLIMLVLSSVVLLCRPADLVPMLEGAPLYKLLIVACLALSAPRLLNFFSGQPLWENGIVALVLVLIPAVMLSHLAHADMWHARIGAMKMAKAVMLFLLVVGLVDTPLKLRALLASVTGAVFVVTVLAVLNYHGVFELRALAGVVQRVPGPDGPVTLIRLCGTGVFNDPNDYSLVLVVAGAACAYYLGEKTLGTFRWALLIPLGLFAYALTLTHSRGGLISATAALLAFLPARLGWKNALPWMGLIGLGMLLGPSWGRQTNLNLDDPEDTFQTRIDLWYKTIEEFKSSPLFGIGQGNLVDALGAVAHNSYLHAFAELGIVGGTAFVGAFYLLMKGLWKVEPADPALSRLRPYLFAITVGYAAGLLSLSRCYTVPTQLVFALGASCLAIASPVGTAVLERMSWACVRRMVFVSIAVLGTTYLFVREMLPAT